MRTGRPDLALADFDAALAIAPDSARPLFGRGLARIRHGDRAAGEADIAAAGSKAPNLKAELAAYGLIGDPDLAAVSQEVQRAAPN